MTKLRALAFTLLTTALLYAAPLLAAAEEAAEAEPRAGLGTLFLLLGVGAVIVVGGAMVSRGNPGGNDSVEESQGKAP